MSDVMLLGVLRMPMPENPDPMTLRQFVSRSQQAACRIEADADELEELRAAIGAAVAAERETFTPAMIEAIYAAWHGAGVDIAGGNWARFVGMLPRA